MNEGESRQWKWLYHNCRREDKQLSVKGTGIRAIHIYVDSKGEEARTPEQLADDYNIPLEAVLEAIEYGRTDPPEVREDRARFDAYIEEQLRTGRMRRVGDFVVSNNIARERVTTYAKPEVVRDACRFEKITTPTPGFAPGFVQANLVVVPRELAFDFLLFCTRNPKPCPLLDVTEPGDPEPKLVAPGADLRTDLPAYRVWQNGELVDEPTDIHRYWRDDLVAFLLGCSFTFENALQQAGVPVRHIDQNRNVPMYRTNIACKPAGVFGGPMVVSMRPLTPAQAVTATRVCGRFPRAHGTPIHFGDPAAIGVGDIDRPDFGDAVDIHPGEVPVFWACGVTPQAVVMAVKPAFAITHKPGHMFLTDLRDTDLEGE